MKSHIRMIAVAALASVASLAPMAHAQTAIVYARMKVLFDFQYGVKHFPAGTYIVTLDQNHVLMLRGAPGSALALADVNYDPGLVHATQVVFKKYGDRYFFEEMTVDDSGARISIPESETERQMAAEWAMKRQVPSRTALALLLEPSSR